MPLCQKAADCSISRHLLALPVILVFSLLMARYLMPFGSATTPDSLNYLDIAKNIKTGHGVLATDYSLENADGQLYKDMKLWPPLYPLVLAATSLKLPDVEATSRLSAVLLALSALFAYLLLAPVIRWYFALPASLVLCLTAPLITVYSYAWSETLFIPLTLATAWAAIRYLEAAPATGRMKYLYLALLVIFLVALAYTRYIGIALALLLPATYLLSDRMHRPVAAFAAAVCVYAAAVGYMLVGNYLTTGSITGGVRLPSGRTFLDNLYDMLSVVDANIPSSSLVLMLILVAAVGISLVHAVLVRGMEHAPPAPNRNTRNVLLLVGMIYLVTILTLRLHTGFDRLDMRLLSPALTVLWILLLVLLVQLKPVNKRLLIAQVLLWSFVIMFPVKGYSRFQDSIRSWNQMSSPNHSANNGLSYLNYTKPERSRQTRKMLEGVAAANAVVVTDNPLVFEFVSGFRSLKLPEEIDLDVIDKLNALPPGSLVLLPNDKQQKGLLKLRLEHKLTYEYFLLGKQVAVRTPIFVAPGQ